MITDYVTLFPFPDWVYRLGIRSQLRQRLAIERDNRLIQDQLAYANRLKHQPIAIMTQAANDQHYEVPIDFYQHVMGDYKKYSCGLYESPQTTLTQAEEAMLTLTCQRAELADHQHILELGCGWGSLTLFMAERFPNATIMGISNSQSQRHYIEQEASKRGLNNISIKTMNVADLELNESFDRIVSVEMLEHVRNYDLLFSRIAGWLVPNGRFFAHIFGHQQYAYLFDDATQSSWMARHFFSGGQMPSQSLFSHFQSDLTIVQNWTISGNHYARTCSDWLANMDKNRHAIKPIFDRVYGKQSRRFWIYWRLFFMACEELFAYKNGEEWQVYHYLFAK